MLIIIYKLYVNIVIVYFSYLFLVYRKCNKFEMLFIFEWFNCLDFILIIYYVVGYSIFWLNVVLWFSVFVSIIKSNNNNKKVILEVWKLGNFIKYFEMIWCKYYI